MSWYNVNRIKITGLYLKHLLRTEEKFRAYDLVNVLRVM